MHRKLFAILSGVLLLASASLAADFTYTDKTEITGGSMKSMMRAVAVFSREAGKPVTTTHKLKGSRKADITGNNTTVTDLNAGTITVIDHEKKRYSVITFAEMAKAMEELTAKMSGSKPAEAKDAKMDMKFSAENTGKTKDVLGVPTKQTIVTMDMQVTDARSGQSMNNTVITNMWNGKIPGSDVMREFNIEMGKKMAGMISMNPAMMQMGAGMMKGMGEMGKKLAEMEGMPMETVMRMGPKGIGSAPSVETQSAQGGEKKSPSVGDALKGLGGFGGFGRKPKKEEPPPQPAPNSTAAAPDPNAGLMMESTTAVVSFSSDPIDASAFEVPAGFKQVEHPMKKQLK
ncbi:MAG: hypothetical protein JJE04_11595 [Acidobacteriia bacterium]|nr:hypothetical protein [Terriglobia bacterium]